MTFATSSKPRMLLAGRQHQSAFSNELCLQQEPVVWIPNAILIGGVNTFQPVVSFADCNYRMEIHNRWGDVPFSTEDFATGQTAPRDQFVPEGTGGRFITIQDGSDATTTGRDWCTCSTENKLANRARREPVFSYCANVTRKSMRLKGFGPRFN